MTALKNWHTQINLCRRADQGCSSGKKCNHNSNYVKELTLTFQNYVY